jgi:hypothetical protein
MGTGNKLDPTAFRVADIHETSVCPLARIIRKECRKRGIDKLKVVYSEEDPIKTVLPPDDPAWAELPEGRNALPGSVCFVPAVAGMIIAGAMRRVPTMVDGVNATAAALLAYGLYPECAKYMLVSHLSSDISHKKMLEVLNLKPIVDAGMRLGEGTGANLAVVVLQSAIDVYNKLSR